MSTFLQLPITRFVTRTKYDAFLFPFPNPLARSLCSTYSNMPPSGKGHSSTSKSAASIGQVAQGSSRTRGRKLVAPGHGIHYTSPQKKRVAPRKQVKVACYATAREVSDLAARMESLKKNTMAAKQFQDAWAGSAHIDCPIPDSATRVGVQPPA
jgi:hypothetical protein